MHSLEYMILQLAIRIERETGDMQLAGDARSLAGATHHAFGETSDENFLQLNREWQKRHEDITRTN